MSNKSTYIATYEDVANAIQYALDTTNAHGLLSHIHSGADFAISSIRSGADKQITVNYMAMEAGTLKSKLNNELKNLGVKITPDSLKESARDSMNRSITFSVEQPPEEILTLIGNYMVKSLTAKEKNAAEEKLHAFDYFKDKGVKIEKVTFVEKHTKGKKTTYGVATVTDHEGNVSHAPATQR